MRDGTVFDMYNKVCMLNLIMKYANNFGLFIALGEHFDLEIALFHMLRSWTGKYRATHLEFLT